MLFSESASTLCAEPVVEDDLALAWPANQKIVKFLSPSLEGRLSGNWDISRSFSRADSASYEHPRVHPRIAYSLKKSSRLCPKPLELARHGGFSVTHQFKPIKFHDQGITAESLS
jgi:hypothetical protein